MPHINTLKNDAENGIADAIVELGICYLKGAGIQKNRVEAVNLFRRAALKNNYNGMFNLAMCLFKGQGCSVNEAEAIDVLQKSAELKHIHSINYLGSYYRSKGNLEKAIYYYKMATKLKDPYGMSMFASLYMYDPEKSYAGKKLFYYNYIIINSDPKEYISTLEKYELGNLESMVTRLFERDYLSTKGECALLTIPSFSTQYIWEIVKTNNGLGVKQTVWDNKADKEKIMNILSSDIENRDINMISRPFTIQPTIESIYLNVDSCVLQDIIDRLKKLSLPLNLIQDRHVICDGIINKFKMGFDSTMEISWNTYLPKAWREFDELLSLLKNEICKDPNAVRE